jgi:hypothetical protein
MLRACYIARGCRSSGQQDQLPGAIDLECMDAMSSKRVTQSSDELPEKDIQALLVTWTSLQVRSDVPAPKNLDTPGWLWQHEEAHGLGFLRQRRDLLKAAFGALQQTGVDRVAVMQALHDAKLAHLLAELSAFDMDCRRDVSEEAEAIKRAARPVLRRWLGLHDRLNPDGLRVLGRNRAVVQSALDALKTDPALNLPSPLATRRRRDRRGRPPRPWLTMARLRLAALGVTRFVQNQLLRAAGLLELTDDDRR